MATGRGRMEWAQTAEILTVLYNANRDPKKKPKPYRPSDFNPYAEPGEGEDEISVEQLASEILAVADGKQRKARSKTNDPRSSS